MSSATIESTPPERASVTRAPDGTYRRSCSRTHSARSLRGRFLELAIVHQPLEARLDELGRALVREAPQRILQRLLQALRGGGMVAVSAAQGLVHDLVDQAERLQAAGRDPENLGDRKSTRLNSSHLGISYDVFCF